MSMLLLSLAAGMLLGIALWFGLTALGLDLGMRLAELREEDVR